MEENPNSLLHEYIPAAPNDKDFYTNRLEKL